MDPFFLFSLEGRRFALELSRVDRVVAAVAVTPLSDAPPSVRGVINVHGEMVPVVDLRLRLALPPRNIRPDDSMVIARTARRAVAFFADTVHGVVESPEGAVAVGNEIVPGLEFVKGVMQVGDKLVLIHDLDLLLSLEEEARLAKALGEGGAALGD
jgi:purine-binding chemotaxis protein CheW